MSILSGPMLYLVFGLSASTLGFGYLSYSLYADKAVAVHALKESQETIAGYEKSLNLQIKSCEISDEVSSEYQAEKQVMQGKTHATISKIDSLPKKAPQVSQDAEIDIDSKLPADLQRVLSEASNNYQGSATNDAR